MNTGGTILGGDGSGERWFSAMGWRWRTRPTQPSGLRLATPSNTPGGSTSRNRADPTSNNFIHITGGWITADPANIHILVDGGGNTFNPLQSYSYQIAQVIGRP